MAQIEAVLQTDSVTDDIWRKPVAFVSIHTPILPITAV